MAEKPAAIRIEEIEYPVDRQPIDFGDSGTYDMRDMSEFSPNQWAQILRLFELRERITSGDVDVETANRGMRNLVEIIMDMPEDLIADMQMNRLLGIVDFFSQRSRERAEQAMEAANLQTGDSSATSSQPSTQEQPQPTG